MPELRVNDNLRYALSGVRIPVVSQPIDNCPQCGVASYSLQNDGYCSNRTTCGFIDPRVVAAQQAWQQATQVQAIMRQQEDEDDGKPKAKEKAKAAAVKQSGQQTPAAIIDNFSNSSEKVVPEQCNVCHQKSIVDGTCTTRTPDGGLCHGSLPPTQLRSPSSPFTGINEKTIKNKGIAIRPTFAVWNSKARKKIKASKNILDLKLAIGLDPRTIDPGMLLDSSVILGHEPAVRADEMLGVDAQMQTKQNIDSTVGEPTDDDQDNNSEELQ